MVRGKKNEIIDLLRRGLTHGQISIKLGISKGTISQYVAQDSSLARKDPLIKVNWDSVDTYFQDHGFMVTCNKFNIAPHTLYQAIIDGKLDSEDYKGSKYALQRSGKTKEVSKEVDQEAQDGLLQGKEVFDLRETDLSLHSGIRPQESNWKQGQK